MRPLNGYMPTPRPQMPLKHIEATLVRARSQGVIVTKLVPVNGRAQMPMVLLMEASMAPVWRSRSRIWPTGRARSYRSCARK
jgi:hypothetical protein